MAGGSIFYTEKNSITFFNIEYFFLLKSIKIIKGVQENSENKGFRFDTLTWHGDCIVY